MRRKRRWHWKSEPLYEFGYMIRKIGRRQASPPCWVWFLQDCTFFLLSAWVAQQQERTSIGNRGGGEGTETSSPGKSAWDNPRLLLGRKLFYTGDHLSWTKSLHIFICYYCHWLLVQNWTRQWSPLCGTRVQICHRWFIWVPVSVQPFLTSSTFLWCQ